MKYFLDTEFIEGKQKRPLMLKGRLGNWLIGYPKPTIDLISIGIVSEDGREYYAVSKDFNLKEAWNRYEINQEAYHTGLSGKYYPEQGEYWLRNNVLKSIFDEYYIDVFEANMPTFNFKSMKYLLNEIGKSNKEIAEDLKEFVYKGNECSNNAANWGKILKPQFYGYYADYDWVVFCWLFGLMIDLPNGFPKYCIDLKQLLDEKIKSLYFEDFTFFNKDNFNNTIEERLELIKKHPKYPKQYNEHNALDDAKWNKALYNFLTTI